MILSRARALVFGKLSMSISLRVYCAGFVSVSKIIVCSGALVVRVVSIGHSIGVTD